MLRHILISVGIVVLASVGGAEAKESPFNVDFFCGWGGFYRPMQWTPVVIGIGSTLTEPFNGALVLTAPQDGLNTLNIQHRFVQTPDVYHYLPLAAKFAYAPDRCEIELYQVVKDRLKTRVYHEKRDVWSLSPGSRALNSIEEKDMLIGHIGARRFGLLNLPTQAISQSHRGMGRVYLGNKIPKMVPWDWTGFASLDLLIVYDPDWSQFRPQQLKAISDWVSNGGKVLLVLGTYPLSETNPIKQMLPVTIEPMKQVEVGSSLLSEWDLESGNAETVASWPLTRKPGVRMCEARVSDADCCLFATGYVGYGRIGVLALDPANLAGSHRANSSQFWVGRIEAVLEDSLSPAESGPSSGGSSSSRGRVVDSVRTIEFADDAEKRLGGQRNTGHFETGLAQAASNAVMNFLYKGIEPLSIWWVILLLVLLAVLLGPVDYIVLKRLGRLPLTWVTCTFWIVLFTVGAYYGVQFLRSGGLELRAVSILDGIEGNERSWSTSYCGLFAPRSDEYRLKDLSQGQWWSGMAPSEGSIWGGRGQTGGRKIYCNQGDGENWPSRLPINIWTIQCLMNEGPVEDLPLTAEFERRGNQVTVSITNKSDSPILGGYVLVDAKQGIRFYGIAAGATEKFDRSLSRVEAWRGTDWNRLRDSYYGHSSQGSGTLTREHAYFAQGCLQRTRAIDAYVAHGAAVVCAEYEQSPVPYKVDARWCEYDHIQLARLVVFPKEENRETGP